MRRPFKRAHFINWGCVGPALVYPLAAVAILLSAIMLLQRAHHPPPQQTLRLQHTSEDTLARELARCQALGRKAEDDAHCLAAWAENRRRFFGLAPSPKKAS